MVVLGNLYKVSLQREGGMGGRDNQELRFLV